MSTRTTHPLHPLWQQWLGCWLVLQGWVLRDPQRMLRGRCELLLGQIGRLQQRVNASAQAELRAPRLST